MASPIRSCWLLTLSAAATLAAQDARPLPDQTAFLQAVRSNLQSDRLLQSRYTYREKRTDVRRDDRGVETGRTEKVIDVYPQREKRSRDEAEERRKENAIVDDAFQLYDFQLTGRETLDDHEAITLTFAPVPGATPRTSEGKLLQKLAGRAWVAERDHQLMRLEVEAIDDVSFGWGFLARLYEGSQMVFQRRPVNDVWLPSELRYTGGGRVLLVKKLRLEAIREYSDYKAFATGRK
jgi:hypothetical protein